MFQKIPNRSRSCDRCSRSFEPHEHYFTLLLPGEEEEWARSDRCASCWEERQAAASWRSAVPPTPPKEERKPLTVEERLINHLAELVEAKEAARALLLALYLERQGVLVRTGRRKRKSGLWLDYKAQRGETTFSILQVDVSQLSSSIQTELVADLRQLAELGEDSGEPEPELVASEGGALKQPPTSEEVDVVYVPLETS